MSNTKKKIQNYWNKQPCNVKHSKKKYLSKEYFDEVKKKRYFVEPHIKSFVEFKKYISKSPEWISFFPGFPNPLFSPLV